MILSNIYIYYIFLVNYKMCVISYMSFENNIILFKNRDRLYDARIKIIHEIRDRIEICYLLDIDTNWIEGLNEYGISLLNSALLVKNDELEGTHRTNNKGSDGEKILKALCNKSLKYTLASLLTYTGGSNIPLMGHTIVANQSLVVHLETTTKNKPIIKKITKNKLVLTNHGIETDSGYKSGRKKKSSLLRKNIIEKEIDSLQKFKYNQYLIFKIFSKNYEHLDARFHPYRSKEHSIKYLNNFPTPETKIFSTTSQIFINTTQLKFIVGVDKKHGIFYGYENKLPKGYLPKITFEIFSICKEDNLSNLP